MYMQLKFKNWDVLLQKELLKSSMEDNLLKRNSFETEFLPSLLTDILLSRGISSLSSPACVQCTYSFHVIPTHSQIRRKLGGYLVCYSTISLTRPE